MYESRANDAVSTLTLRFDQFGGRQLYGAADDQGRTPESILVDALAHLDAGKRRRRLAAVPPAFVGRRSEAELSIQLATPSSRLERLRGEARRRRVPVERLVEHALLLYLADLDWGTVRDAEAGEP